MKSFNIYLDVGYLTILFIILKLCNVIKWNWLWVLSPIWITLILSIMLFMLIRWVTKDENETINQILENIKETKKSR